MDDSCQLSWVRSERHFEGDDESATPLTGKRMSVGRRRRDRSITATYLPRFDSPGARQSGSVPRQPHVSRPSRNRQYPAAHRRTTCNKTTGAIEG